MKILIVDDDPIALEMLQNALEQAGHLVTTAANGAEALELLCENQHNIVISDWEMPLVNGVELCHKIRAGKFPSYVYIILLTGRDRPDDVVAGMSAGADDFIAKPFNPAELQARVRAADRVLSVESRELTIFAMAKLVESRDVGVG